MGGSGRGKWITKKSQKKDVRNHADFLILNLKVTVKEKSKKKHFFQ